MAKAKRKTVTKETVMLKMSEHEAETLRSLIVNYVRALSGEEANDIIRIARALADAHVASFSLNVTACSSPYNPSLTIHGGRV